MKEWKKRRILEIFNEENKTSNTKSNISVFAIQAVDSIMRESKTGRTYKRGSVTHQASAEGEAPASNTGFLVNNVYQKITRNGLTGIVESRAGYSAFLEYGTQKMGARPYMFPALEKTRQNF